MAASPDMNEQVRLSTGKPELPTILTNGIFPTRCIARVTRNGKAMECRR